MTRSYLEQQSGLVQSPKASTPFVDGAERADSASGCAAFLGAVPRVFCCLSMLLLLLIWPSSDWIGLLVLSQALFAAAYLLKSTSAGPSAKSATASGPISLAGGEDHVH